MGAPYLVEKGCLPRGWQTKNSGCSRQKVAKHHSKRQRNPNSIKSAITYQIIAFIFLSSIRDFYLFSINLSCAHLPVVLKSPTGRIQKIFPISFFCVRRFFT